MTTTRDRKNNLSVDGSKRRDRLNKPLEWLNNLSVKWTNLSVKWTNLSVKWKPPRDRDSKSLDWKTQPLEWLNNL